MGCICPRRSAASERHARQCKQDWANANVKQCELVVRSVSGEAVLTQAGATFDTPVASILKSVCERLGAYKDTVQLFAGSTELRHERKLGECVAPPEGGQLELLAVRRRGPAVVPEAMSGRDIQVMDKMEAGAACHFDREYKFISWGDFDKRPNMFYVKTPNDDKGTSSKRVMWKLHVRYAPVTVYLNFRSEFHVTRTGAAEWLEEAGWQRTELRSTVSSGIPNGPYRGPVFSKSVDEAGEVHLMGSACGEGTYFVFFELPEGS